MILAEIDRLQQRPFTRKKTVLWDLPCKARFGGVGGGATPPTPPNLATFPLIPKEPKRHLDSDNPDWTNMKFANESNLHETRLIFEASKGDLNAFNHLVLKYEGSVFNRAYALLGDRYSAEDATQKSFIKAFQNMSGFRCGFFRAWLLRIVINTCYDEIRWSKRHPTIPLISEDEEGEGIESPTWLTDPNHSVEFMVEREELSHILYRMLDELPEIYRNPVTLIDLHDLAYSEAAEVLEIPIGTVKSRLSRARFQMKKKLQNNFTQVNV